jgi:hypothetical protein
MNKRIGILLLALCTANVQAGDKNGRYGIIGAGVNSCGKFIESRRNNNKLDYLTHLCWMGGFITSVNVNNADTYNLIGHTDMDGVMLWMENYCQRNPLDTFTNAAQSFVYYMSVLSHM